MANKTLTTTITLAELLKRVPKNQLEQFEQFSKKTLEYQRDLNKYPEKLPNIDWEFYRNNVQKDAVSLVNTFEIQYKELDYVFASRHSTLDFSKYYTEWKELLKEAQDEVKEYIEASKERVQLLEEEIKRLMDTQRFTDMTIEELVVSRPDISENIPCQGRPIFWPPFDEIPEEKKKFKVAKKEGDDGKSKDQTKDKKEETVNGEEEMEGKQEKDEPSKENKDK